MTYQDVVDLIRTTAETVNPSGFFTHARRVDFSLNYDETGPYICLLPVRSTDNPNTYKEEWSITMLFLKQDAPDSTELEREGLIQDMYTLSKAFTDLLYESMVELGNILRTPEYRILSATATGYSIQFTLLSKEEC